MKAFVLLSLFASSLAYCQTAQDYKYISVPTKFEDSQINKFNLAASLAKQLKAKKYVVLSDDASKWPAEVSAQPCQVLKANIKDTGTMLRNRVDVILKDCNDKTVLESRGSSMIKEFEPGINDALILALGKLPASVGTVASVSEVVASNDKVESVENTNSSGVVLYTNGASTYQKIQTGEKQFILVVQNSASAFATFVESSRKDTFHVTLKDGKTTMAYVENGNLVVDMPSGNSFTTEVFKRTN